MRSIGREEIERRGDRKERGPKKEDELAIDRIKIERQDTEAIGEERRSQREIIDK